jgi:hypothetical protein
MSIWAVVTAAVVFISVGPLPKLALRISYPVAEATGVYLRSPQRGGKTWIPGVAPGGL